MLEPNSGQWVYKQAMAIFNNIKKSEIKLNGDESDEYDFSIVLMFTIH